jgi:molybdopterin biosynthesis enzyme
MLNRWMSLGTSPTKFASRYPFASAPLSRRGVMSGPLGEDIVATQLVLPAGHTLSPADLGAIAASGHQEIKVARKPKVAILPTGTELVPIGSKLKAGDILEYNSLVIAAQIKSMGGEPTRYPITKMISI